MAFRAFVRRLGKRHTVLPTYICTSAERAVYERVVVVGVEVL